MASYPTSVKSFAARSAGQTIASAHMNDVQDEINAIEAGLLQGSAPLNSSNSTVANLSVSGNSTIAGELFVATAPPSARVYNSATLGVAHNSYTALTFDSQRYISTSAMHSTAANPSRLIPPSSGVYFITGHVTWSTNSTAGTRVVQLIVNSTTTIAQANVQQVGTVDNVKQSLATAYNLSTSDYVELRVYQDSGSTGAIVAVAASSPEMTLTKIR